jgi:biotin transport system substrate-specific component
MQPFFVLLTGFILGTGYGVLAVCLYLAAGLIGLPVFAGGTAGFAHLLGPTGGFLLGFVACAACAGRAAPGQGREHFSWGAGLAWGLVGILLLYLIGVFWLKSRLAIDWKGAVLVGFVPFFPGDLVKIVLAVLSAKFLHARRLVP